MAAAVETSGLGRVYASRSRRRRPVVALDDVTLSVERGEVHGLLGPNGAGKTTLVRILATVLTPTSGAARVLGHDVVRDRSEVRERIGLVFGGDRGLYNLLTARHNLEYWAALYGVPSGEMDSRVRALLERVGLGDRADDRVETFSRGMKQRLHLARGLIGGPEVLFLDEPTTGLDPVASGHFRDLVLELRDSGITVFLTTHDMAEAEGVCDRVSLIDRGRLLATEVPSTLGAWVTTLERVEATGVDEGLVADLRDRGLVGSVERLASGAIRFTVGEGASVRALMEALLAAGVTELGTRPPSLEEVYVSVFGARGLDV